MEKAMSVDMDAQSEKSAGGALLRGSSDKMGRLRDLVGELL